MFKIFKKKLNKKGFTLVELVVVIAIIGILAGFAVPKFLGFQESARLNSDVSTAKQIADIAAVLVSQDKINLPETGKTTDITITSATASKADGTDAEKIVEKMQNVPTLKSQNGKTKDIVVVIDESGVIKVYGTAKTDAKNLIYPTQGDNFKEK